MVKRVSRFGVDQKVLMALGLTTEHVVETACGAMMQEVAARSFYALQTRAQHAGFQLSIASSFRSYERQLAIFNAKWRGERPVLDDDNIRLAREDYSDEAWLHRILRFSALPGTSRHHWGTDVDVFDPSLIPPGKSLALTPSEYRNGGRFSELSLWLDELIANNDCEGFYRPYDRDRGGVSEEPWHLSYAPIASKFRAAQAANSLRDLWLRETSLRPHAHAVLIDQLDELMERYVV